MVKFTIINDQHLFSGVSNHIYNIYENLKTHNIDTELYQFLISNSKPESSDAVIRYGLLHSFDDRSKYIYDAKLAINFVLGINWRSFKSINHDIMLLSGPSLLPLAKYCSKTIAIGHDLYFIHHGQESVFLRQYMRRMYKYFNNASQVIVDSKFTKNEFVKELNIDENKIEVVYPYVHSEIFHPGVSNIRKLLKLSDKDVLLLSIGGDNPNKNIETILKLMKRLPPKFKLIRVGRNFNTNSIIFNSNLRSRVILVNNVDVGFLAELYRGSDVFLFPSLYEGFGIPLIEAMASGIPFITSNQTSLPEVASNSGIICDPFDIEFMLNAIIEIAVDENLKTDISKKGIIRASDFSAEKQYQSLCRAIKRI